MARRSEVEEPENHERWLVSYADFITLLFAFFVVMYSLSSVNEGKYRILSDSLVAAFRNVNLNVHGPQLDVGSAAIRVPLPASTPAAPPAVVKPITPLRSDAQKQQRQKMREKMRGMAEQLLEALGPLIREGRVSVTENQRGVTVEINNSVLFPVGDAHLEAQAISALQAVARVIAPSEFPIIVEGHTDPTPISTRQFPSNWELSGARASSVVRLFVDSGVDARRLTASGFGEQRPVASNDTAEGRARNRRVTILIEAYNPDEVSAARELELPRPPSTAPAPSGER